MKKHCYILVSADFRSANEGYRDGVNVLQTITTSDNRIVVSINSVNEFPELFADRLRFIPVWLSAEDFPSNSNI